MKLWYGIRLMIHVSSEFVDSVRHVVGIRVRVLRGLAWKNSAGHHRWRVVEVMQGLDRARKRHRAIHEIIQFKWSIE